MEHVWHHKVRHLGRFSLFRQGPFQRTPQWPKVTGTRGSWDLAISLKMISKTRRLMSFVFFKIKMSVLERQLSGQKVHAAKPDDSNLSAGADMGERTERTNSCMLFSDLHTCTHITQDQCRTASISVLCLWSTHPSLPPLPQPTHPQSTRQMFIWSGRLLLVLGQSLPNRYMLRQTFKAETDFPQWQDALSHPPQKQFLQTQRVVKEEADTRLFYSK